MCDPIKAKIHKMIFGRKDKAKKVLSQDGKRFWVRKISGTTSQILEHDMNEINSKNDEAESENVLVPTENITQTKRNNWEILNTFNSNKKRFDPTIEDPSNGSTSSFSKPEKSNRVAFQSEMMLHLEKPLETDKSNSKAESQLAAKNKNSDINCNSSERKKQSDLEKINDVKPIQKKPKNIKPEHVNNRPGTSGGQQKRKFPKRTRLNRNSNEFFDPEYGLVNAKNLKLSRERYLDVNNNNPGARLTKLFIESGCHTLIYFKATQKKPNALRKEILKRLGPF